MRDFSQRMGVVIMEDKRRLKIQIFDQNLFLKCTSPDEIYALARVVDERMKRLALQDDRVSITNLAIFSALSIAQDWLEAKRHCEELEKKLEGLERRLVGRPLEDLGQPRH